jgi:dihydrodipicolinate synthase/N-acetylneuraminate lyase
MMNYKDLKESLKGVVIVQVTPFKKDGSLDLEGLRKNTRWTVDRMKGKDVSFMIEGSNGEFFNQSEEEWKTVVKTVVDELKGEFPVLVHAAQCSTQETIKRAQYAQSVGADGVIAVLPYYIQPQEEGMYLHYKKICESVDIGVICYNNTFVSSAWIRPVLMAEIAKIPNFVGVKENTSDIISFRLTQQAVGSNAVVMCGRGEEIYPYEARFDCPGFVSFIANFAPELSYEMYQLAMAKQYDKIEEMAKIFTPFFKDATIVCNLTVDASFLVKVTKQHGRGATISGGGSSMQFAITKEAMNLIGLSGGEPRLPLIGITAEEKEELGSILKNMSVL